MRHETGEARHRDDIDALDDSGLRGVVVRDEHRLKALLPGHDHHRKHPVGVPHAPVERELPKEDPRV